ncbi:hypothetical protein AAMO2058_001028900 [Amorphochlora amoebiformis]
MSPGWGRMALLLLSVMGALALQPEINGASTLDLDRKLDNKSVLSRLPEIGMFFGGLHASEPPEIKERKPVPDPQDTPKGVRKDFEEELWHRIKEYGKWGINRAWGIFVVVIATLCIYVIAIRRFQAHPLDKNMGISEEPGPLANYSWD